ncbi:acyl carrier protein [Thiomicrorhabdus sp. Milos-T2]|uniref:acyl carrier protein n=1 Tax=Thiomicrorhabdus sp. Milos-T2 TaxID=90814 RepID=UPI00068CBB93|nr:phosphopantetheine-binding protein [Thiomicrorhabdus sp. Milos-T2]
MSTVNVSQILEAIENANLVADVTALDLDKPLRDQGIDSLDFSGVLFNVEEAFGIEIPDDDIDGIQTINQIVTYVNAKV